MAIADTAPTKTAETTSHAGFWGLTLGAVGVVYGDIGTSPLYAFREAFKASGDTGAAQHDAVLGVLSLIFWALMLIVTIKYVAIMLRADNDGEGGTLTLLALAQRGLGKSSVGLLILGGLGASLFFGDAIITPAISVLSAVEGLKLVTSTLEPVVIPVTLGIIVALFAVQFRGTGAVASFFGPITLIWFATLAIGGLMNVAANPAVVAALNPFYALSFMASHGLIGLAVLGAVFLAVTGAEALYADLGHFGRGPIQFAWLSVAMPALCVNYFGQGALVLNDPSKASDPFFLMYPDWALLPVVIIATAATIIASQAVITGAYSLSRQAIQLRLLPRMRVFHTSETQSGQIYMPFVNLTLLIGVVALVLSFRSSSALSHAYGIAVTGTMVVTAILAIIAIHRHWGWSLKSAVALMIPFLILDLVFLGANLMKFLQGGYVPILIAIGMGLIMWTWIRGSALLARKDKQSDMLLADLLPMLEKKMPSIVPGTAVFLTADGDHAPVALMHSLKHFKSLHEDNVILTVVTANVPRVPEDNRVEIEDLIPRFRRVTLRFGYMEEPNIPAAMGLCRKLGWKFDIMATSFLVSRRSIRTATRSGMPAWQSSLFIFLSRNAASATDYFHIPAGRVVEIGTQVNI
jgi:KUP system potassium uptake protein